MQVESRGGASSFPSLSLHQHSVRDCTEHANTFSPNELSPKNCQIRKFFHRKYVKFLSNSRGSHVNMWKEIEYGFHVEEDDDEQCGY